MDGSEPSPGCRCRARCPAETMTPSRDRSRRIELPALIAGVSIGLLLVSAWTRLADNWATYVTAAMILLAVAPIALRAITDPEAILAFLFVFSLQFNASFNVLSYEDKPMPGGAQGFTISLVLLLALALWLTWGLARR